MRLREDHGWLGRAAPPASRRHAALECLAAAWSESQATRRWAERWPRHRYAAERNRRPAPSCAQAQLHAAAPVLQLATDDDPLGASAEGLSGPRGRASQSGEYQIVRPFAVFSRFFVRVSGTVL